MSGVRARDGEGCSNSSDDEPIDFFRRRKVPRTFYYRNPTSVIIQSTVETRGEEDAQSEEADGEQDHHLGEQEVEEGQQSEEDEGDQDDVDDLNVEAEGEQDHHISDLEAEEGQQSEEDEEDQEVYDDLNVDEEVNNGLLHVGDQKGRSSTSATREGSNIVINLTDPGLLDCPICFEPLTIPVFQCDQNGHIACSSCCTKINNKCPFCSCPIGSNRCRAIENVVESSTTPCQNSKYGCSIPVAYNKKYEHEKACVLSPCSCPFVGCKFVSSTEELYQHFSNEHRNSATGFLYDDYEDGLSFPITLKKNDRFLVVREKHSGTLFILHNRIEALGNVVTVSCVQPSFMDDFNYFLLVTNKESSLKFRSVTKNIPSLQVDGPSPASFLLVPCEFFDSCGHVKIDVSIRCKW